MNTVVITAKAVIMEKDIIAKVMKANITVTDTVRDTAMAAAKAKAAAGAENATAQAENATTNVFRSTEG